MHHHEEPGSLFSVTSSQVRQAVMRSPSASLGLLATWRLLTGPPTWGPFTEPAPACQRLSRIEDLKYGCSNLDNPSPRSPGHVPGHTAEDAVGLPCFGEHSCLLSRSLTTKTFSTELLPCQDAPSLCHCQGECIAGAETGICPCGVSRGSCQYMLSSSLNPLPNTG